MAVRGDLDVTGAADAREAIAALVVLGRCLLIAMSALDFIDCGSLGALLRVQRLAWSTGGEVVVAAPQRHVLRLLALTGRDHAFLIHASVQAAVAARPVVGRSVRSEVVLTGDAVPAIAEHRRGLKNHRYGGRQSAAEPNEREGTSPYEKTL